MLECSNRPRNMRSNTASWRFPQLPDMRSFAATAVKTLPRNLPALASSANTLIYPITDLIFDRAADLWAVAQLGGHSSGDADLIIAATALKHRRVLVTGNTSHFAWISGLRLEDWRQA